MSNRNDDPTRASRPFDRDRDGFVMGEGGAVLILEEWSRAIARGARIYGELAGYGTSNDAHHMTAPLPGGTQAARCMRQALDDADVAPHNVEYINAHGSSTPLNDPTETEAIRTVFGDHKRFEETYFSTYPGKYFTGDGCRRDADGYYWITGRVDDVINVSGHRMGTAEVESALVSHAKVSEAAVVGYPHDIKGQGIFAYVTLMSGSEPSEALRKELVAHVRKEIGPIASPDVILFAPGLPKTRSGKIMRRILRKIAENEFGSLGDTSTLADPGVVDDLIASRKAAK